MAAKKITVRKSKTNPDFYEVCEGGRKVSLSGGRNAFMKKADAKRVADARRKVKAKRAKKTSSRKRK